jgi:hypothetical protein
MIPLASAATTDLPLDQFQLIPKQCAYSPREDIENLATQAISWVPGVSQLMPFHTLLSIMRPAERLYLYYELQRQLGLTPNHTKDLKDWFFEPSKDLPKPDD